MKPLTLHHLLHLLVIETNSSPSSISIGESLPLTITFDVTRDDVFAVVDPCITAEASLTATSPSISSINICYNDGIAVDEFHLKQQTRSYSHYQ